MADQNPNNPESPSERERKLIEAARRQEFPSAVPGAEPAAGGTAAERTEILPNATDSSGLGEDAAIAHVGASLLDSLGKGMAAETGEAPGTEAARLRDPRPAGQGRDGRGTEGP